MPELSSILQGLSDLAQQGMNLPKISFQGLTQVIQARAQIPHHGLIPILWSAK
jgi:hypothetical protein